MAAYIKPTDCKNIDNKEQNIFNPKYIDMKRKKTFAKLLLSVLGAQDE